MQIEYNNGTTRVMHGNINISYLSSGIFDEIDDNSILRFATLEHEDDFGKYKVTILHDLINKDFKLARVEFSDDSKEE